jgi:putative ABC transport system permease protein
MRMMEQRYRDYAFRLVASDTVTYLEQAERRGKSWKVLAGAAPIGTRELRDHPYIVLAENAAHLMGLHAGDRVALATPTGPVELEVRAIVVDYSSDMGAGFIDRELYLERWQDPSVDAVNLYLRKDADVGAVSERVRARLGGGEALFVTETTQLREQFVGLVEESFSYSRSLELIVLVIALLGVVGTMVAAVLDRRGEIGMLRAVGATRRQVAVAMLLEAAFLGLCAAVGGVLAGSLQCVLFLETLMADIGGWHLPFIFPTEGALRISLLVVITAAAAGRMPALRASKTRWHLSNVIEPIQPLLYICSVGQIEPSVASCSVAVGWG